MRKINLFNTDIISLDKFIRNVIYLYHLYTKDKMRSFSRFIDYLDKGYVFEDEFKDNDTNVRGIREYLVDHYEYDLNNDDFKELIKTSLYEYIANFYCYLKDDIDMAKSVILDNNLTNDISKQLSYLIHLDYFHIVNKNINKFLFSTYDFKRILDESIDDNIKNEISKSIQNLGINIDKNFEFFVNLRIFIDSVENATNNEENNIDVPKDKWKKCFNIFLKNNRDYFFTKKILDKNDNNKIFDFFSKIFINMLNSYAHNPTHKKDYNYTFSKHNYFLKKPDDFWNDVYIYDVFKIVFYGHFLNLLDKSLKTKMRGYLTKRINENYHRIFCCYFQYMLYLFLKKYSDIDNDIYNFDGSDNDYEIKDYNDFFNIFNLKELNSINNKDIIIENIKKLNREVFNFSNANYFKKWEFIVNKIEELNLAIFNNHLITIKDVLSEVNKIKSNYNHSIDPSIQFEKIYIFLTVNDYKKILDLTSDKSKEVTIKTNLDFYNFIIAIKDNPLYFVISFLNSNNLLSKITNFLSNLAKNIDKENYNYYSTNQNEKYSTIYEKRILLSDHISKKLNKIKSFKKV